MIANPEGDSPRENQRCEAPVENQRAEGLMVNEKGDSPSENRQAEPDSDQRGKAPMVTRKFLAIGLALAVIIGILAVFFAAGGPDGLESTALVVLGEKSLAGPASPGAESPEGPHPGISFPSPFPDYHLGEGTGHAGQVLVIVLGIALVFGAAIAIPRLLGQPGKAGEDDREKE